MFLYEMNILPKFYNMIVLLRALRCQSLCSSLMSSRRYRPESYKLDVWATYNVYCLTYVFVSFIFDARLQKTDYQFKWSSVIRIKALKFRTDYI